MLNDVKTDTPRYTAADRAPRSFRELCLRWETLLALLLLATVFVNSTLSPFFLDPYNLADSTFNFSEKALLALGLTLIICAGEIDISVAAIMALASVCMGLLSLAGFGTPVLVLAGLAVGLACGALNGFIVTGFGVPSVVVTIGTLSLFRGLTNVILGDGAITQYPAGFGELGQGYVFGIIPIEFIVFLVLAAAFAFGLHRTRFGRNLYAIGNNAIAARYAGIPVQRYRMALFMLSGLMAGLAAVLLTSRVGSTRPNIASGWELEAITMVVLGGVSINGGSGSVGGVVLAILLLGMVTFGMSLLNVPGIIMTIFTGLLLIGAIAAPILIARVSGQRRRV